MPKNMLRTGLYTLSLAVLTLAAVQPITIGLSLSRSNARCGFSKQVRQYSA